MQSSDGYIPYETIGRIDGWFNRGSYFLWTALLGEKTEIGGNMLEIGCWHGKSAIALGQYLKAGEKLILVDIVIRRSPIVQAFAAAGLSLDRVVLIECRSADLDIIALHNYKRSVRFLHIDGEHTGEAVYRDLELADTLVHENGLVVVDDIFSPVYPQITEATYRFLDREPFKFRLLAIGFGKAYLVRPNAFRSYADTVITAIPERMAARGFEVTLYRTSAMEDCSTIGIQASDGSQVRRGPDSDKEGFEFIAERREAVRT